jgi:hypothetical protein
LNKQDILANSFATCTIAFTVENAKLNIEKSATTCKDFTELKTLVSRKEFWQDYLYSIYDSVIKHKSAKVLTANKETKKTNFC